jgi:hemin uptake protein HemP
MPKRPENKGDDGQAATSPGVSTGRNEATDTSVPPASGPLSISSEALLAGRSEVHIHHRGDIYRLTLTRAGKLILHK